MNKRWSVYVFQDPHFAPAGDTVVSATALELVVSVYGGGGMKGEEGLATAFGGAALYRNDVTGDCFLGVWGERKGAPLRQNRRDAGVGLTIIGEPPPARLIWFQTHDP